MKRKTLFALIILTVVLTLLLFYAQVSSRGIEGISGDIPGYECGGDMPCTACMVEGELCNCGADACRCGMQTVNRSVCE